MTLAETRTILYVRHAESVANAGGVTLPNNEIPLSEDGQRCAFELAERLPAAPALVLWEEPDPHRRAGPQADTFMEFQGRVRRFIDERLDELPDGTVIFGHGIWCGMLRWQLEENRVEDAGGMLAFRRISRGFGWGTAPRRNCVLGVSLEAKSRITGQGVVSANGSELGFRVESV